MLKRTRLVYEYFRFSEIITSVYDIAHHLKYSFDEKKLKHDKEYLKYYLTKHYHIIEKGLALPAPKPGFGQPKILSIIELAKLYENSYGNDKLTISIKKAISEYLAFHQSKGHQLPVDFFSILNKYLEDDISNYFNAEGGLKSKSKNSLKSLDFRTYSQFVKERQSVRNFSDEDVSQELLSSIVHIAQFTPSVCNRQAWKAHCYSNKNQIKKILSMQNGNSGFTDAINKLIIVTGDTRGFSRNESKQIFIDGGLFSMSLLYAIHAAGLGACPLNTCVSFRQELRIKSVAKIPDNERVVMMIAIGCLKHDFQVAYSARNPLSHVIINH